MNASRSINDGSAVCGVIGLGYVGLPLLVRLGQAGFRAVGIDVSADRVAQVQAGRSYIDDVESAEVARLGSSGLLSATTDFDVLTGLDTVNICVPTPLGKSREPDMSFIVAAIEAIATRLQPGQLVILESTTYPGTTEELVVPTLEESGLKCGEDFFVAFSPERIDPGNKLYPVERIPKVVGGVTPACTELACRFYAKLVESVIPVSSARAAELTKLLENTYRIVNIALVSELALMADGLGVDVWEVVDAAATKPFGFMPFYPGPGLGGHCIPVDPFYLSWKVRQHGQEARFIELAGQVNRRMPEFVVEKVSEALNDQSRSVRGSRVLVLGVTYKKDVADVRESAALDIMEKLALLGADVAYSDPYVPTLEVGGRTYQSQGLDAGELTQADCVVIVANHSRYDYERIVRDAHLVVDTRNATKGIADGSPHIYRLGVGRRQGPGWRT